MFSGDVTSAELNEVVNVLTTKAKSKLIFDPCVCKIDHDALNITRLCQKWNSSDVRCAGRGTVSEGVAQSAIQSTAVFGSIDVILALFYAHVLKDGPTSLIISWETIGGNAFGHCINS